MTRNMTNLSERLHTMMAIQRPIHAFVASITLAFTAIAATPAASAQGAAQDSGDNIVLEAAQAAKKLTSFKAKFTLSGAGGLKDYVPTSNGTLRLAKLDEPIEGLSWITRIDADYTHTKNADEQRVTAMRTPELFVFVDHESKMVQEQARTDGRSQFSSAINLTGVPELTGASPYERELREALSWNALGREAINGVLCDVVEIQYDMEKNKSGAKAGNTSRTPAAKWYFGVEDRLPRRIERITDEGLISFSIILELTGIEANPGIDPASLEIETPEGYSRTVSSKRAAREAQKNALPVDTTEKTPAVAPENDAALINLLPAHGFELADSDGNLVTLESLKGNVTVLYFWGTWCGTCKAYSPLVSNLVTTFAGEPVKVFGLPVRERNADTIREVMSKYNHTLLLNPSGKPIGCDETARAYKVRRFPTIYVIGADSNVLAVKWSMPDVEPADMMAQVESAIREGLDAMSD